MCRHFPELLTVEFNGKSYPNLNVKHEQIVRCKLCSRHGILRNGESDFGKEPEVEKPVFKRRKMK